MLQKLATCVGTNLAKHTLTARQRTQFMQLRRREFIGLLGAAAACPLTAAAQSLQPDIGLVSIAQARPTRRIFARSCNRSASSATPTGATSSSNAALRRARQPNRGFLADLVRRQVDDYRRHWHTRDNCRQRDNLSWSIKLACMAPEL
jgi:hypothetical protein